MSSNARGYSVNVIKLLQDTLLKSYEYGDGFSILKELLQNANDAASTELRIYYFEGIKDAKHPLLKVPGVLVYDNGKFTQENEDGIGEIGGEDKDNDTTKIGKYGLGMKSIFHICDMFFYIVNSENRVEAINPWRKERDVYEHIEWTEIEESDKEALIKALPDEIKSTQGLTLLLPQKSSTGEHIGKEKVNIDFPFNSSKEKLIEDLTTTLALLVLYPKDKNKILQSIYYKTKDNDEIKVSYTDKTVSVFEKKSNKNTQSQLCYLKENKFEKSEDYDFLQSLIQKNLIKDKITNNPEACLEIIKTPSKKGKGKLKIQFCVFLPLQEPHDLCVEINTDYNYTINIHGSLLVDSGRKGIFGFNNLHKEFTTPLSEIEGNEEATKAWNRLIAQNLIYPLLPRVLEQSNLENIISDSDMSLVLSGIKFLSSKENLINSYTTTHYGFVNVYVSSEKGKVETKWCCIDLGKSKDFVCLPYVDKNDYPYINILFPNLSEYNNLFVCGSKSTRNYILPESYEPSVSSIKQLINNIPIDFINDKKCIDLVTEFIVSLRTLRDSETNLEKLFIYKFKQALYFADFDTIKKHKNNLEKLFNAYIDNILYSPDSIKTIYKITYSKLNDKLDFWKKLWNSDSDFIFVPSFINITNSKCTDKALIGTENERKNSICHFLLESVEDGEYQTEILKSLLGSDFKQEVLKIANINQFKHLNIYQLYNFSTANGVIYCNNLFIEKLINDRLLFVGATIDDKLLKCLAQLLPELDICSISNSNAQNYGLDTNLLVKPTNQNILKSLSNLDYESLNYNTEEKIKFIQLFLNTDFEIPKYSENFYRFLIMNFRSIEKNEKIWKFADSCSDCWIKIFNHLNNGYEVMPIYNDYSINNFIKKNKAVLKIDFITNEICFDMLNKAAHNQDLLFLRDDPYLFNDHTKNEILQRIKKSDKELFMKLPYFEDTISGDYLDNLDNNCFLNTDKIVFPKDFNVRYKLIKLSDLEILREKQELFISILTRKQALLHVLHNKKSNADFSNWIFDNLAKIRSVTDIKNDIMDIPWIPISKSDKSFCSLNEILPDNILGNSANEYISNILDGIFSFDDLDISSNNKLLLRDKKLLIDDIDDLLYTIAQQFNGTENLYLKFDSFDELSNAAKIMSGFDESPIFHFVDILQNDKSINDKSKIFNYFYNKIHNTECQFSQLIKVLNYITTLECSKKTTINLFNKILKKCVEHKKFMLNLVKYPSLEGEWRKTDSLVPNDPLQNSDISEKNASLIDANYLLDPDTYRILKVKLDTIYPVDKLKFISDHELKDSSSEEDIKKLFDSWIKKTPHTKLIYLFLYLLRGNFRNYALKLCSEEEFSYLYDQYRTSCDYTNNQSWCKGYGDNNYLFGNSGTKGYFSTCITTSSSSGNNVTSVSKFNLDGKYINVPLILENQTSPFIDQPFYSYISGRIIATMIPIPDDWPSTDRYAEEGIRTILRYGYSQLDTAEIERLIDNYKNKSQHTIEESAKRIFDDIFTILRMLNVKNATFKNLDTQFNNCYTKYTTKSYIDNKGNIDNSKFANEKKEITNALLKQLEHNPEFQGDVFNAVVHKIQTHQYSPSSVLFELFQNSDDCVNDLVKCGIKLKEKNRTFKVELKNDNSILYVSSYGRRINEIPAGKKNSKYKQDLLNMLSISASAKEAKDGDTGRFGLGFKSIYNICKEPIIRSGELNFKIIAGVYPLNVEGTSSLDLDETRFELKLLSNEESFLNSITDRFKDNILFLCIFAKQIHKISFLNQVFSFTQKQIVKSDKGIVSYVSCASYKYVLFKGNLKTAPYSILYRLDKDDNIVPIQSEVNKVWNVTPLDSVSTLPFAISADFVVDTGRLNLASNNKQNAELLLQIAKDFYEQLNSLWADTKLKNYVIQILELLVSTYNISTDSTFDEFAKYIILKFYEQNGILPSGCGKELYILDTNKIYGVAIPNHLYSRKDQNNFINDIQMFAKLLDEKILILPIKIINVVKDVLKQDDIPQFNIKEIFIYKKDRILTPDILETGLKFLRTFNLDSFCKNYDLNDYYLLSERDTPIAISSLTDIDLYDYTNLNKHYSRDVIESLVNNYTIIENTNKKLRLENAQYKQQSELQNSAEDLTDNILFDSIYSKWLDDYKSGYLDSKIENYYNHIYPDTLSFANLKESLIRYRDMDLKENQMPIEWCLFLLIAMCQSLPTYGNNANASNKHAINWLSNIGIIKKFCDGECSIDELYDLYLKNCGKSENRLRHFETLLRLYKIRKNFGDFISLLENLPLKQNLQSLNNLEQFLNVDSDPELSGMGYKLPSNCKSLKLGIYMIIRDLLLCNFWDDMDISSLKKFAYMPKKYIKDVLEDNDELNDSTDIYDKIKDKLCEYSDDERYDFVNYFDLPFYIYRD